MTEEEIVERIKLIDRIKDSGDTYTRDDVVAISGLLDLYQKEKQANEELRKICYGKALEELDTSRIYEEEQRKRENK